MDHRPPEDRSKDAAAPPPSRANHVDRHVGLRIRERRVMAGLTQRELATLFGVTYQQVHKYENGTNRVSAGRLHEISKALDVGIAWFFEGLAHSTNIGGQSPSRRMMLEFMRNVFDIQYEEHLHALSRLTRALSDLE